MLNEILWAVAALGGIGLVLGIGLAIASKLLSIEKESEVEAIRELLPGANCGGCGFPGCDNFAKALYEGSVELTKCSALSCDSLNALAVLLGVEASPTEKILARVLCHGDSEHCIPQYKYTGIYDCRAAAILAGGPSACTFGCVGLLTCAKACAFGAISMNHKGLASIDETLCTGCGRCAEICPKNVIALIPQKHSVYVACRTTEKGMAVAKICKAGCFACGLCSKKCPEAAIEMTNNLPVIDYDKCTGCGVCASVCPKGSIAFTGPAQPEVCAAANG